MADKKTFKEMAGALPTATDVDSIMAKDANGNPIWIKKADLAQVAAELIGTASTTKDGLMNSRFANREITLQPSGTAKVVNDYYGLIAVREISKMGLNALLSIQWNSIIEIHKSGNQKDKLVFSSTNTGALIITNNLDEEVTLDVRYLI